MSKALVAAALVLTLFASTAPAADDAEFQAQCTKWAEEEGVKPAEMAQYVSQCVDDLKSAAKEEKEGAAPEKSKE